MEKNSWIVGLVILVVLVGLAIWGFSKNGQKNVSGVSTSQSETKIITGQENYFDVSAKVMYFYQPTCHYCLLESPILQKLAVDGYRVKPMDAAANPDFWAKLANGQDNPKSIYKIQGTPAFIGPDGNRLDGYQKEADLKAFLDKYRSKL